MSDGLASLSQSTMQGQGRTLAIYEVVAAEVGNDTASSAIIRRIVAITQAAADGGTTEVGMREEADIARSEGSHSDTERSVDARTVLAGASTQSHGDNAPTNTGRKEELRPLLIPAKAYPPSGSDTSPINVNEFHSPIDVDQFDHKSP